MFVPRSATPPALTLDPGAGESAAVLADALVRAIATGQLADGDVLPSTRSLSAVLGIGRSRVVEAYQQLAASGFVAAVTGGVTRVERGAAAAARAGAFVSAADSADSSAPRSRTPRLVSPPARFDLRPGYPDESLINAREWNRAWRPAVSAQELETLTADIDTDDIERLLREIDQLSDDEIESVLSAEARA